ncbi:hypothetical protein ABRP64_11510, partial [Corynebacterium sp. KPL4015]|uniref:hypothetical protein n=1 Tax=Corynebacterium sp. KPL4015 TaxID=3158326 RepID=UPI00254FB7CF
HVLAPDTITLHALSKGRNTTQTDLTLQSSLFRFEPFNERYRGLESFYPQGVKRVTDRKQYTVPLPLGS